ncbi:MAG: glycosyltransferase family 39 protein [Candidatus Acidiferrum sp.]
MSTIVQPPPVALGPSPEVRAGLAEKYTAVPAALALSPSVYALAIFALALHMAFNGGYGFFRDELYYAACGQRLAWGYVDHAPLAPFLARLSRVLLGDALRALRFLPALSSLVKVLLAGWMAREMGGGRTAQFLAALTVLLAPIYLTFDNFFSMNAFEPVFWMASAAIVLRILNGGDHRLWLLFGVVAGLGLQNKHSMLFFGSGLAVGLLLTPARREFTRIWIWIGAAVALLIFLPNLLWEIHNGWPTIALLHAVIGKKYSTVGPLEYVLQQALLTNPLSAPIWLAGLWFLLRDQVGKTYSVLAWAYLTVLAEMIYLHGKIYYLAPAYVMLFAAGAAWIELRLIPRTGTWLAPAIATPLIIAAAVALPLAMPVLPVDAAVKYCRFWDVQSVHVENIPLGDLPQLFGDMYGWPEQAAAVARVYNALPASDRAQAAILAKNYGEASAVDYFGPKMGLPLAISGHNQYGFWGPRGYSGEVVVAVGFTEAFLRQSFSDIQAVTTISPSHAMPEESGLTIYVCRQPKAPLQQLWPGLVWLD